MIRYFLLNISFLAMSLFFGGCFWAKKVSLNQDNLNLIKDGMSNEQVARILGEPDLIKEGQEKDFFIECWVYSYIKMNQNCAVKMGSYPLQVKKLHVWFNQAKKVRDFSMRTEDGIFETLPSVEG
ncbi:outer membrane protein assembly factor BamE [Opitutales bacterium]|nr:outer membrane protein assembly factor BamE [Opitutales bacterium]